MLRLMLLGLVCLASAEKLSFDDYKVFRIYPRTHEELEILKQLNEYVENEEEYSFWSEPGTLNSTVDLMVAPKMLDDFRQLMRLTEMKYQLFIDDVQRLIDQENPLLRADGQFGWTQYHTLEEIYAFLDLMAKRFPNNVQVIVGGRTYEGRDIKGVKVRFGKTENPGVVIEGGIHAREWITPATVTYILNELLTSKDAKVRAMADRHDWYIFPSFNPDGFVYTLTTNRMWRKTRKPYGLFCKGSDPNRNWSFKWMHGGASSSPCAETYAGSEPFSCPETRSLSQYITSISDKFYAYISFHSYSQLLMFPYGHTTAHLENYDDLLAIGKKTIGALAKRYGTSYRTGNIAETIYIASGASIDWVMGSLRKPVVYTYELRDNGRYGFLLPASQIIPTAEETLDSLVGLFEEAKIRGYPGKSLDP